MKIGFVLPFTSARTVADLARAGEEAGWDGVFLGDAIWCEDPMVALAAAATVTARIRLGTLVVPAPLHRPWRLASAAVALDRLSGGRLTLGLGTGATWMGWQAFPDEVTDARARSEMLDETVDILTLLFQRQQFDYEGRHFHLKLSAMDVQHYPPRPVQLPRVPIWVPAQWPRERSARRALKADGMVLEKVGPGGQGAEATPEDARAARAFVQAALGPDAHFDIVASGSLGALEAAARAEALAAWRDAGATWWVESMWGLAEEQIAERVRRGPA